MDIIIDTFTPCLIDTASKALVETHFKKATRDELPKGRGWLFHWADESLRQAEIFLLMVDKEPEIQGVVALTDYPRDRAIYVNLAESAPHNRGKSARYQGVGGHLFAIAAKRSLDAGYGGFLFFDAKNEELVEHYEKTLGAKLLGMPHKYRMVVEEKEAQQLIEIYTLK